jgi:hypothetical protein
MARSNRSFLVFLLCCAIVGLVLQTVHPARYETPALGDIPQDPVLVPSRDLNGRDLPTGPATVVVLPPCDSCSSKRFLPDKALSLANSGHNIVLIFQETADEIPAHWKLKHERVFSISDVKWNLLPSQWYLGAPRAGEFGLSRTEQGILCRFYKGINL